jgi:hypothetical protein
MTACRYVSEIHRGLCPSTMGGRCRPGTGIPPSGGNLCSVLPGLGPAAEALLFRQKDPKPLTPCSAESEGTAARGRADQLAALRQGPQEQKSVRPRGRPAGVGRGRETNRSGPDTKKARSLIAGQIYNECRTAL